MTYRFSDFALDLGRRALSHAGSLVHIEPSSFDLLCYLIERRDRVVSRRELLDEFWADQHVCDDALTQAMSRLRRALRCQERPTRIIQTLHRRGYRFIESVSVELDPLRSPRLAGVDPAAPLLGRTGELTLLQSALAHAQSGRRRILMITGELGIGKTSLLETFLGTLDATSIWIGRGQCVARQTEAEPYQPVLEALRSVCLGDGGSLLIETLRRHAPPWIAQIPDIVDADERRALTADPLVSEPQRMLRLLAEAVAPITAVRPLVLVLEDIHWADLATLDLIAAIARGSEPARLLLLATHRPLGEAPIAPVLLEIVQSLERQGRGGELRLGPLPPVAVGEYVDFAFPQLSQRDTLASFLHKRSGGNPLFIQCLAEHFQSQGWIRSDESGCELTVGLDDLNLKTPRSLERIVQLHLAALTPADITRLEAASVVGPTFTARIAAAGCGEDSAEAGSAFTRLARHTQLIARVGETAFADSEASARFEFAHEIFRTTVYDLIPPARRQQLHRRIGDCLEKCHAADAPVEAELAHHFQRAGDVARSVHYLRRLARTAERRGALREAAQNQFAALQELTRMPVTPEREREELDMVLRLAFLLGSDWGFHHQPVGVAYRHARRLAERLNDQGRLCGAMLGLVAHRLRRGENLKAYEDAVEAMEIASRLGAPQLIASASCVNSCVRLEAGMIDDAQRFAESFLRSEPLPHGGFGFDLHAGVLAILGLAHAVRGDLGKARACLNDGMLCAAALGSKNAIAQAHLSAAQLAAILRDKDAARHHILAGRESAGDVGLVDLVFDNDFLCAWSSAAAPAGMRDLLDRKRAVGQRANETFFLALLAESEAEQGELGAAQQSIEKALAFAEETGQRLHLAELHRIRGDLRLASEAKITKAGVANRKEAAACYRRAIEIAHEQGARLFEERAARPLERL